MAELGDDQPGLDGVLTTRRPGTLALSAFYAAAADRALGRELDWQPVTTTLRDGLMEAITR